MKRNVCGRLTILSGHSLKIYSDVGNLRKRPDVWLEKSTEAS